MRATTPYDGIYLPREGHEVGHLKIADVNSELRFVGTKAMKHRGGEPQDFHGTLATGTKASALQCIPLSDTTHSVGDALHCVSVFFPHYIVLGQRFISSTDTAVCGVHYNFENADCMVNSHKTFRSLVLGADDIRKMLASHRHNVEDTAEVNGQEEGAREPQIGKHPQVLYYSGVRDIVTCRTDDCTVTINNQASYASGSSRGIGIENQIVVSLKFGDPRTLRDAIASLHALHRLFELVLGRRQRYVWIDIELANTGSEGKIDSNERMELHWSYCNDGIEGETKPTSMFDVLIDAGRGPDEFATVAKGWMASTADMAEARSRFATAFHSGSYYGVDRTVGAANMFDLLPQQRSPTRVEVDASTQAAVEKCRAIFRDTPESSARHTVLSALGRVGTASLRDKVLHRADVLIAASGSLFSEIHIPCTQAVVCRNHFVHGSAARFDYYKESNAKAFLTDTLEFVFGTSDLIELGWNFHAWWARRPTMRTHAFGSYVRSYKRDLAQLKALLEH